MDKTVALYMRLSDEDDNLSAGAESNSISHQRKLMLDHIAGLPELRDYTIVEFSDDGYSGASFDRPDFQRMMKQVKSGQIQVIVTKDYSRLGRDYLEVGNYMEYIFPMLQIRYISVNDGYDSDKNSGSTGGMSVALKNLVNAMYCRDASKKVRAAKAVLAKQGKYIAAFAPFGYQKSGEDKHVLTPDPKAAPVVRLIFELAIKGKKYTEIADYLNKNGYDSILAHYEKTGRKRCLARDIGLREWSPTSVMEILYNEVYIGTVLNNKFALNIDTGHKMVTRDKSEWIKVENCHEQIVSVEEFKLAHKMIGRREYVSRKPNGKWHPSIIRCAVCGKGLNKYNNNRSYSCRNGHVIIRNREDFEAGILECVRKTALCQLENFEITSESEDSVEVLEDTLSRLQKSVEHYSKLKFEIYDSYSKGDITREQMVQKTAEVKTKLAELDARIEEQKDNLMKQRDLYRDETKEQLTKLSRLETYDEAAVRYLINQVKVTDAEHVEIEWNFDDFIQ